MTTRQKRIAINVGWGYVPGLNAVITGTVLAASELGWDVVGIRDGFIVGTAGQSDPFHVRTLNAEDQVEELDRSDELLATIEKERFDAVISVVGSRALSVLWKLNRKGLAAVGRRPAVQG